MARRERLHPCAFRLDDRLVAVLDRTAADLERTTGLPVNRSEALRFILECSGRAEYRLPEIGDLEVFKIVKRGECSWKGLPHPDDME